MKRKIFFLDNIEKPQELIDILTSLSTENDDETENIVMLNEFDLTVSDIMLINAQLKTLVVKKNIYLVMAPTYDQKEQSLKTLKTKNLPGYQGKLGQLLLETEKQINPDFDENKLETISILNKVSWNEFSVKLKNLEITCEDANDIEAKRIDTIGFFYSPNGLVHAFPKSWEKRPIHKIPNTKIGVTICGEVNELTHQNLEGLDVVYNPSREHDDPIISLRMQALLNPDISRDEVWQWLNTHIYNNQFSPSSNPVYTTMEKEDFEKVVSLRFKQIQEQKNSMYLKDQSITDRIPVIRCDGRCSGILNPGKYTSVMHIDNSRPKIQTILFYTSSSKLLDRKHARPVSSLGMNTTNQYLKKLKGDALKRAILAEFKSKILKINSMEELNEFVKGFKSSEEYKILAKPQGIVSTLFRLNTTSVKTVVSIIENVKNKIIKEQDMKNENKERVHVTVSNIKKR